MRIFNLLSGLAILLCRAPLSAQTQAPAVGGVVNSASFAAPPHEGLAPGSIATIFGERLAASTATSSSVPLPRSLTGTSVFVGGISAPIYYVSPGQINFQVPSSLLAQSELENKTELVVAAEAGTSRPFPVRIVNSSIGALTATGSGCGPGIMQNHTADGQVSLNTPENSAEPGGYISLYLTGVGPVYFGPADGEPATLHEPLARAVSGGGVELGLPGGFTYGQVLYSGRAPGMIGVDQITARLPADAPEGCAVPLSVTGLQSRSQPVTISIRRGGGQCTDQPLARVGSVVVRRTTESNSEAPTQIRSARVEAAFEEAPESQFRSTTYKPAPDGRCSCVLSLRSSGPVCPNAGPTTLNAGTIRVQLPDGDLNVVPEITGGRIRYSTAFPADRLTGGPVRISSNGGTVGPFEAINGLPSPIQIQTPLAPGTIIPWRQPFRITWTGGSAHTVVVLRLIGLLNQYCECATTGDTGFLEVPTRPLTFMGVTTMELPILRSNSARVEVSVSPLSGPAAFQAPGLTAPGTLDWVYDYKFSGLSVQ